ncbi:MAG: TRAP transporter small permease subunit [Pseudomonadota bacterium]
MTLTSSIDRWFDRLTGALALAGLAGLVLFAALTFYDGTARYFNWPRVSGFSDYAALWFPVVIASCFPASLMKGSHITVKLAGSFGGPAWRRWLDGFAAAVTLVVFALVAWQLIEMSRELAAAGRTTPTIEMPVAPWWFAASAIFALSVPVQGWVLLRTLGGAWRGEDAPRSAGESL